MKGSRKKFPRNVNPSHSSSSPRTPVIKIDLEHINRLNKTVDEALDMLIDYLDNNLGSLGKTKKNQPRGSPQSTASHPIGSSQPTSLDLLEPNRSAILQFAEIGVKMGMKEVIAKVLENVGKSHWILVGFLCLGVAVDCVITKYPNDYQCRILLESMLITAKKLRKVKGTMEEDTLKHALQIIIENAVICMDYLEHPNFLRFLQAKTMEEHLKSSNQELQRLLGLLNFDIGIMNYDLVGELAGEIKKLHQAYEQALEGTTYAHSKVRDLLECSPVGIEDDVQCIACLLKNVANKILFVYHKLKSDLQQAFMLAFHVGYYFLSHPMWEEIELHVPKDKLTELQRIGLLKREDNNLVIHDILRVMAVKEYFVPEMEEDDDKPVKGNSGIERCEQKKWIFHRM